MYLAGMRIREVSAVRVMMTLAGFRNMAITQCYIDLRPGMLRNAVELI